MCKIQPTLISEESKSSSEVIVGGFSCQKCYFGHNVYFWNSLLVLTFDLAENKVMHFTITFGLHVTSPFNISTLLRSSFVHSLVGKKYELCIERKPSTAHLVLTNWFSALKRSKTYYALYTVFTIKRGKKHNFNLI